MWPVGFAAGVLAEGPLCKDGHVTAFHSGWASYRKFPLDMAGTAVLMYYYYYFWFIV